MKRVNSNPFITSGFEKSKTGYNNKTMRVSSTIIKSLILIGITVTSFGTTWSVLKEGTSDFNSLLIISSIAAVILSILTSFIPKIANVTSILYAMFEGVLLASFSMVMESNYPGIVFSATCLTFAVAIATLLIYRRTPTLAGKIRKGVTIGITSVFLLYILSFILSIFGIYLPIYGGGTIGIGFSVLVVTLASFSLILDYDFILKNVQYGAPKYMEWYSAFGLLVTLIWLYIEIVQLISKLLQSSRD
ncbi:Bax inhibitor-1/YccA family protein [Clostridium senegalense]|uniref:Bax inhibitor-1/YccA family protein n=1 Tax=Clostridium senegalense TaxID=1465809 RepID=UPI000287F512|nr:Bax inhibitor-1/YccA family protein [Clostridium senegalense]